MTDWTPVFDDMIEQYGLTTAAVYGAIFRQCLETGECKLSHNEIAKIAGLKRRATINHIEILVKDGHILEQKQGKKKPNIYTLAYARNAYVDSQHMHEMHQTYALNAQEHMHEMHTTTTITTTVEDNEKKSSDKEQFQQMMELYHNNVVISESPTVLEEIQAVWDEAIPPSNETKFTWFEYAISEACASGPRGRNWRLVRKIVMDITAVGSLAEHKQLRQEQEHSRNGTHPKSRKKKKYDIIEVTND